jgi:hypothetical protein
MSGNPAAIARACEAAGRILASARAERDQAAAAGTGALADLIAPGCTEAEKVALAAYWAGLVQQQEGGTTAA